MIGISIFSFRQNLDYSFWNLFRLQMGKSTCLIILYSGHICYSILGGNVISHIHLFYGKLFHIQCYQVYYGDYLSNSYDDCTIANLCGFAIQSSKTVCCFESTAKVSDFLVIHFWVKIGPSLICFTTIRDRIFHENRLRLLIVNSKDNTIKAVKFIGRCHSHLTKIMDLMNFCCSFQVSICLFFISRLCIKVKIFFSCLILHR